MTMIAPPRIDRRGRNLEAHALAFGERRVRRGVGHGEGGVLLGQQRLCARERWRSGKRGGGHECPYCNFHVLAPCVLLVRRLTFRLRQNAHTNA